MSTVPVRVLIVDDYDPWQQFVLTALRNEQEVQIVGVVSDGLEAVQVARKLQPDLILLDIGLPRLNGIEAARRIRGVSPNSKILFVSENRSWDIAREALRIGAIGYVVKSDARDELRLAINSGFEGKPFVSASLGGRAPTDSTVESTCQHSHQSMTAPVPVESSGRSHSHDVLFYSDDAMLLDRVAQFIGAALKAGDAAIVVATEAHREGLLPRLQANGVDVGAAIERDGYVALDAADTVSTFVVNNMLDTARFMRGFGDLILRAAKAAKAERVVFFGEGTHILWTQGNVQAAIEDERLCNKLIEMYDVDILCGYFVGGTEEVMDARVFQQIREQHSAVHFG